MPFDTPWFTQKPQTRGLQGLRQLPQIGSGGSPEFIPPNPMGSQEGPIPGDVQQAGNQLFGKWAAQQAKEAREAQQAAGRTPPVPAEVPPAAGATQQVAAQAGQQAGQQAAAQAGQQAGQQAAAQAGQQVAGQTASGVMDTVLQANNLVGPAAALLAGKPGAAAGQVAGTALASALALTGVGAFAAPIIGGLIGGRLFANGTPSVPGPLHIPQKHNAHQPMPQRQQARLLFRAPLSVTLG